MLQMANILRIKLIFLLLFVSCSTRKVAPYAKSEDLKQERKDTSNTAIPEPGSLVEKTLVLPAASPSQLDLIFVVASSFGMDPFKAKIKESFSYFLETYINPVNSEHPNTFNILGLSTGDLFSAFAGKVKAVDLNLSSETAVSSFVDWVSDKGPQQIRKGAYPHLIFITNNDSLLHSDDAYSLLASQTLLSRATIHAIVPLEQNTISCYALARGQNYLELTDLGFKVGFTSEVCGNNWKTKLDGLADSILDNLVSNTFSIPLSVAEGKAKKLTIKFGGVVLVEGTDFQILPTEGQIELYLPTASSGDDVQLEFYY